jgi:thymidylate synthase ThyX
MKILTPESTLWGECPTNVDDAILWIERSGRICYRSEDKIIEGSGRKFVDGIVKRRHLSVIEHSNLVLRSKETFVFPVDAMYKLRGGIDSKFIHFTTHNDRVYIGGNFRAWMEEYCIDTIDKLFTTPIIDNFEIIIDTNEIPIPLKMFTAFFLTDRAVTHELVRHRPASYCLSWDTLIHHFANGSVTGEKRSIKALYEYYQDTHKSEIDLIKLIGMDEDGELIPVPIKSIVKSGVKKVYTVTTANGRKIKASKKHRFCTTDGWKRLDDLVIGNSVLCNGVTVAFADEIVSITYSGEEETYDIEIDHPCHNFVANGMVVHNSQESQRYCSYRKHLEVILPEHYASIPQTKDNAQMFRYQGWVESIEYSERTYQKLIELGERAEEARSVLPNSTATRIVVTASIPEWKHIFAMRCSKAAYPAIRSLMQPIKDKLIELL